MLFPILLFVLAALILAVTALFTGRRWERRRVARFLLSIERQTMAGIQSNNPTALIESPGVARVRSEFHKLFPLS